MIAVAWWQGLLNALGWFLAKVYDLIPNFGVAIILLTLAIRVLLLPLGLKQIRSMQAMQAIQPKVKQLQQKYKGNKQKLNEEMMKLYKEQGVNPLAGCLPMLLQLPILIALYSVLRFPQHPPHLPEDSTLRKNVDTALANGTDSGTSFLGMNLLCSAQQAGTGGDDGVVIIEDTHTKPPTKLKLDCGSGIPVRLPYYLFALLMIATTYYQQRQMTRASPAGAAQQQQTLLRIMPILFGIWGFLFPAGLVVYWTTSNLIQIGQQHFLLRAGHIGPGAAGEGGDGKQDVPKRQPTARKGLFSSMLERAEAERARRRGQSGGAAPSKPSSNPSSSSQPRPSQSTPPRKSSGSGANNARSRKKRRKR